MTRKIVGFVVVCIAAFAAIHVLGCWYYTHKLNSIRPEGVNKANLGTIAAQTFRRENPWLLYLGPIAIASVAIAIPSIGVVGKRKTEPS